MAWSKGLPRSEAPPWVPRAFASGALDAKELVRVDGTLVAPRAPGRLWL